jgi:hypothetical protein
MPAQSEWDVISSYTVTYIDMGVSYLFSSSLVAATLERNLYELRALFDH